MKLMLAENIRAYRRERKMTQEQLAGVLGVTVGAVYKWESGLSVPELNMIVEMADFFDTSVDVLLGYRMQDNRPDSIVERLYARCRRLDPKALAEAEKALGRYPNSFRIVYVSAEVYLALSVGGRDPVRIRRALELLERARALLPQNDDPRVGELSIIGHMASAYLLLGEKEKAIDLMKRNNVSGHFSKSIGLSLAMDMARPEESVPYLSEALIAGLTNLLSSVLGYVFVYRSRNDWDSLLAITALLSSLAMGLRSRQEAGFIDKTCSEVQVILAYARLKSGNAEAARAALREAGELAERFDSSPEYSLRTMRFLENAENTTAVDGLGATASESIGYLLSLLNEPELTSLWKEISTRE